MLSTNTMYVALPVANMQEAKDFYGKTLNLNIVDENENGVWFETGQSRIVVYESRFSGTNQGTAAIWEVPDPESMVDALKRQGIGFERYQDLPGVRLKGDLHIFGAYTAAWFKDPFGNLICITHHL